MTTNDNKQDIPTNEEFKDMICYLTSEQIKAINALYEQYKRQEQ